jgi:hypothetical protein
MSSTVVFQELQYVLIFASNAEAVVLPMQKQISFWFYYSINNFQQQMDWRTLLRQNSWSDILKALVRFGTLDFVELDSASLRLVAKFLYVSAKSKLLL